MQPAAGNAPATTDAVVIGAGPAGLFQVFQLGLQGLRAQLFDALPFAGGQCAELYGDKPIYDIPAMAACTGHELVQRLCAQIRPFAPGWHLGQRVNHVEPLAQGGFLVAGAHGTRLHARAVFIASGVGAFEPRALKLPGLEAFAGTQMLHALAADTRLTGLRVLVHGGGEAAVQQAIACATAPEALRAAGRIEVAVGVASAIVQRQERLAALEIITPDGQPRQIPADRLVVRLGLVPRLGPIADWGLALERKQLVVDPATMATSMPGIYAVGDAISYPGKRKLIVSAFHEATLAAFGAAEWLAGGSIPLEYTTSSRRLQDLLGVAPGDS